MSGDDLLSLLQDVIARHIAKDAELSDLRRLSGGASQETWSFDATDGDGVLPLILRRAHGGKRESVGGQGKPSLHMEAHLLGLAHEAGVPVPGVRHVLEASDNVGLGFIMDRIEGETIARKILRDDAFAEVRPKLARQCGEIAAKVHSIPTEDLDELAFSDAPTQHAQYFETYSAYDYPHPVFELAFRWLSDHMVESTQRALVHGDFRNGNLIISPDGVQAVLDWELAHIGDPMEDLAWISVNSWRYGSIDKPVGGFGEREDLFAGYESAGGTVDRERVRYWETFGSLKWGIMCMGMYSTFKTGFDRSVERAAIGRRSSETEIDLLRLLTGSD